MYLKSLTVRGFKSFASATVFEFESGLNVLVGPNGAGKSNVVDALAWVMGAQGAKQLRGGAMKDVIFAGGGSRGALGRAKVELVIDNEDGALPLPHAEIRLSRTMFSAGGSEYEINGEPARLADVQDLLADAGVGRELYTLVGQGQVDKILHGTADDRRELIEQAAGLLKHRKRQAKTASKLDDLKTNLDRLEDLAGELAEQLEGRREQADAARAAREVAGRVRSLTANLLAHDARAMMQERVAEQAAGQQAEAARLRAQERSRALEGQLGELAKARQVAQQALDETTQRRTSLKEVAHLVETVQLVAAERLSASHHEEDQDAATHLVSAQQACAREEENLERAREAGKAAEEELTAAHSALEKAQAEHGTARQALATADQQVRDYKENLSQLTSQLATARVAFERAGEEAARRVAEYAEAKEQGASAGADTERAQAAVNGYREQLERAEAEEENLRRARHQANEKVESSRKEMHQAQVKLHTARARCEALEAAWQHDGDESGDHEGLRQQALEQGAQELISLLEIEDTWQAAVAAALGPYLRALALTSGESLPAGITQLYSVTGDIEQIDLRELSTSQAEVYQARPLVDVLTAPQALRRALAVLTADTYLTPDEEAARTLVVAHPGVRAVTPDGTVLTAGSTLYPSQERPLTERYAELTRAQQTHRELAQQQEQAESACQQAEEALKTAQEAEKAQARTTGSLTAQLAAARADLATLTGRAESSQAALDRLQEAATRAEEAQKETQRHVEAAQEALARVRSTEPQTDSAALREAVRTAEKSLVDAQEAKTLAEATATYAREKEEAAQARLTQAQEALAVLEKAEEARQVRQQEAADAGHRARRVAVCAQALTLALEQVESQENEEHRKALARAEQAQQMLTATREELAGAQTSLAAALTLQAESSAQGARVEARWEALTQRVDSELGLSLEALLEGRKASDLPREDIETDLAAAEAELARLGVINPLALEEYEALEQRHSYLRQQIKDIKTSRADLRAVMKDVTDQIETSFSRALADVQVEFSRIFALLFPGGQAELVLADPNDLEHSGLDIRVTPAGKKVTRLSLLSGGERTLASLALLLAVFMARPAPFYVLDEVEAALDDRNLGRLLEVLGQLREKSQLLMITHHQRTMAQADTLYGITMRQGVSSVLSHRLAD